MMKKKTIDKRLYPSKGETREKNRFIWGVRIGKRKMNGILEVNRAKRGFLKSLSLTSLRKGGGRV